jgi:hypothetical protein
MKKNGRDMSLIEAWIISNRKLHSESLGKSIEVLSDYIEMRTTSIAILVVSKKNTNDCKKYIWKYKSPHPIGKIPNNIQRMKENHLL